MSIRSSTAIIVILVMLLVVACVNSGPPTSTLSQAPDPAATAPLPIEVTSPPTVELTPTPVTVAPTSVPSSTSSPQKSEGSNQATKTEDSELKADVEVEGELCDEKCLIFKEKFAACQPASLREELDMHAIGAGSVAFEYKIIGPVTGGCKVTMNYLSNPNPEWVSKELTCVLDNKRDLEEAVGSTFDGIFAGTVVCEGPLYTLLRSEAQ
jgi:hypothetical protein